MAVHGWRFDLEFLGIAVAAIAAAFLLSTYTGYVVHNALTSILIAVLFFLIGIHLDIRKLGKNLHHTGEIGLGILLVYVFTPLLALGFAEIFTGMADAFLAIGVSAAAIGAPVVWSNVAKGEGSVALAVSGLSVILGLAVIPLLLQFLGIGIDIGGVAGNIAAFAGVPLLIGIGSQRFQNFLFDDFRTHFSKLALWFILLVTAIQGYQLFLVKGFSFVGELFLAVPVLAGFVLLSFFGGYLSGMLWNVPERKSRALGFTAASKSLGISLLIATQLSAEAVAFVLLYFLVRQATCGGIAEYLRHGRISGLEKLVEGKVSF